jgi:Cytochrome C oxidase, cbb3-type, subunit III
MRNILIGFGIGILFVIILALLIYFPGYFNISTTASHPVISAVMDTIKDRSVDFHAGKKLNINNKDYSLKNGAAEFMSTCVLCHGAPGFEKQDFAKWMDPPPPDLANKDEIGDLTDAKLFWIIKNGIMMTGMPAFGKFESDDEVKNSVLMTKELQNLKKEDIEKLIE